MGTSATEANLLEEVALGPVRLRNRLAFLAPTPAHGGTDDEANLPTEELARYWEAVAAAGIGLIVGEHQSVHPTGTSHPRVVESGPATPAEPLIGRYTKVTEAVHRCEGRIFAHLYHPGLLANPGYRLLPLWAPSALRVPVGAPVPAGGGAIGHAMSEAEIAEVVAAFAEAARRAGAAGFDGVEVDAASGYLLAEFLSPATNRRNDAYGGGLAERCRMVVEVLAAVRAAVGTELAVGVRLGPDPYVEGGLAEDGLPEVAAFLSAPGGIDYVSVVPGLVPDAAAPEAAGSQTASAVARAAGVPVLYSGLLTDLSEAGTLVAEGGLAVLDVTRAALADPGLVTKLLSGGPSFFRPCVACNQTCTTRASQAAMAPASCLFTPLPSGADGAPNRFGDDRSLLVVGAGLAGLEVARLAAGAGFMVTLLEAGPEVGGQLRLAARAPRRARLGRAIQFYEDQLAQWGVEVALDQPATVETVESLDPDFVVAATGCLPDRPAWSTATGGADERPGRGASGLPITDVRAVLAGQATLGRRVVLAVSHTESGYVSLAAAEFLADQGHEVWLVTPDFEPAGMVDFFTSEAAYRRLLKKGVRIEPTCEVEGVTDGLVLFSNVFSGEAGSLPADGLVLAQGGVADDALYRALRGLRAGVLAAGDCVAPRDMEGAISDARLVMAELALACRSGETAGRR